MKNMIVAFIILSAVVGAWANTRVIDKVENSDLITFKGGFTVKLTGITAPDKSTKLGYEVYDFTKRTLEGRTVKLFTYTTDNTATGIVRDKDGYAYAQIVFGKGEVSQDWDINFNELLLKKGYARVNEKMLPEELNYFKDIEKKAREEKVGMWKE